MPISKPRIRQIYFRVSEDEFQQFTRICQQEGARSLSDLVRTAMKRTVSGLETETEEPRLRRLDELIHELEVRLQTLVGMLHEHTGTVERKSNLSMTEKAAAKSA